MTLTAVVADDAPLIREAISSVLTAAGIAVLAQASTAEELLTAVERHEPSAAIIDVRLPPGYRTEGLQAALVLRAQHPRLGILLLSQHVEPRYLARILAGGAGWTGYLLKERAAGITEFVHAVQTVVSGGCCFDPEVISALLARSGRERAVAALTPRERQVLQVMAEGASNLAISRRLEMGEKTVESHVRRIFQRLDIADEPEVNRRVTAVLTFLAARPAD